MGCSFLNVGLTSHVVLTTSHTQPGFGDPVHHRFSEQVGDSPTSVHDHSARAIWRSIRVVSRLVARLLMAFERLRSRLGCLSFLLVAFSEADRYSLSCYRFVTLTLQ